MLLRWLILLISIHIKSHQEKKQERKTRKNMKKNTKFVFLSLMPVLDINLPKKLLFRKNYFSFAASMFAARIFSGFPS
jgi:hypothetical protein